MPGDQRIRVQWPPAARWRPGGYDAPPQPLGPDSLTWKYFGDWRGHAAGPVGRVDAEHAPAAGRRRRGALDLLRGAHGRGCCGRCTRSAASSSTATARPTTGAEVRDYHIDIKGVDSQGRRYHALNPDVFYWAHSTFFVGTIIVAERFCGGITEAEKRQLFDEHIAWYRMYGMSMRPVPETWEDFQAYWDHMCRNVLENNNAARAVLDLTRSIPSRRSPQWIPDWLWRRAAKAGGAVLRVVHASGCTTHRCVN